MEAIDQKRHLTDRELLAEYISTGSQAAFAELVRSNGDLVYSAARRQLGDSDLADEVTQAVFILLFQKAATIRGPLAGWLILATHYAARNARKIAARRRFHEKRAAEMKTLEAASSPSTWENYSPQLDHALAKLRKKDRDAIALRFLRGFSLKEVGESMGTSEEAARKRIDRSLDRLRSLLAHRATAPAAAILGAELVAKGTQAAPVLLLNKIAASSAAPVAGSLAVSIASTTGRAISHSVFKSASIFVTMLLLVGLGIGLLFTVFGDHPAQKSTTQTTTFSTAFPGDKAEAAVPGETELIRWHVVLNEQGANALMQVVQPMDTPSTLFHAISGNANNVRRVISDQIGKGGTEIFGRPYFARSEGAGKMQFGGYFDFTVMSPKLSIDLAGSPQREAGIQIVDPDHVKITLNFKEIPVRLLINNPVADYKFTGSIVGEATLGVGDAWGFLAKLPAGSGVNYYDLLIYETFRASARYSASGPQYYDDPSWWCRNGPAGYRKSAEIAEVWNSQISENGLSPSGLYTTPSPIPPTLEKQTSDGQSVRLVSITLPGKWRYCWWDPAGKPAAGDESMLGYRAQNDPDARKKLWAMVQIVGTKTDAYRMTPLIKTPYNLLPDGVWVYSDPVKLAELSDGCDIGVPTGPWKEVVRFQAGDEKTVNGVTYHTSAPFGAGTGNVSFNLTRTGIQDGQDFITAVTKTGEEVECFGGVPPLMISGRNLSPQTTTEQINFTGVKIKDVAYFRVMHRDREWLHFSGYAREPSPPPADTVTAEQVQKAEEILAERAKKAREAATRVSTP